MQKKKVEPPIQDVGHPDQNSSEYIAEIHEDVDDMIGYEAGKLAAPNVV